jgi:hypothetical protein
MSEVALQRLVQVGLSNLKNNRPAFNCIFAQFLSNDMQASYGQQHIDKIYNWFVSTKIPVLQAWSFDPTKVPSFTIHLADESEDESKAAFSDYFGSGDGYEILTGVSAVSLDIGIHADKSKDHVLWLYYILNYVLYKEKMTGQGLGLQLYTFRASEYNKESKYMADNVWSRWVRFRCVVQNYLEGDEQVEPTIVVDLDAANTNDIIVDIYNETLGTDLPIDLRRR